MIFKGQQVNRNRSRIGLINCLLKRRDFSRDEKAAKTAGLYP